MTPEQDAEFLTLFREHVEGSKPPRYGWKRSSIDAQQRDYIIDREAVLEMCVRMSKVSWQSINTMDQELAEKIRSNTLHALATCARSMTLNEAAMLE